MTDLKNKVALVTGSARGIGRAIAERFGMLGASVAINYTAAEEQARETVAAIERLGTKAMAIQPMSPKSPTSNGFSRRRSNATATWTSSSRTPALKS